MACPKLFIPFANCHSLWENLKFYSIPNSPSWTWTCNFLFKCKEKLRNIFLNNDSSCTSCYLLGDTCVISNREKLADWIKVSLSQNLPGVWIISGLTVVVTYLLVMSVWKLFYIKKKKNRKRLNTHFCHSTSHWNIVLFEVKTLFWRNR